MRERAALAVTLLALAAVPWFAAMLERPDLVTLATQVALYALAALGLGLLTGYAGHRRARRRGVLLRVSRADGGGPAGVHARGAQPVRHGAAGGEAERAADGGDGVGFVSLQAGGLRDCRRGGGVGRGAASEPAAL